jgi:hypothetical protein
MASVSLVRRELFLPRRVLLLNYPVLALMLKMASLSASIVTFLRQRALMIAAFLPPHFSAKAVSVKSWIQVKIASDHV